MYMYIYMCVWATLVHGQIVICTGYNNTAVDSILSEDDIPEVGYDGRCLLKKISPDYLGRRTEKVNKLKIMRTEKEDVEKGIGAKGKLNFKKVERRGRDKKTQI